MMRILALLGLVGAVAAQKTKTFSVCTSSYEGFSTASLFPVQHPYGFLSGAVKLYPCGADGKPAAGAASIGLYTYECGAGHNFEGGEDGIHVCNNLWTINGCSIAQVGAITVTYEQVGTGVWSVGPTTAASKGCPKASAYQSLAFDSVPDTGNMAWEKYTFTIKGSRTPLTKRH